MSHRTQGTVSLQSHGSSGGSRDFDAEMAGMLAANGSYGNHQSSSPHYGSTGASMNKFSPDPRVYLASSLYAPSGATSAYQVSPARSRCVGLGSRNTCGRHDIVSPCRLLSEHDSCELPDLTDTARPSCISNSRPGQLNDGCDGS